MTLNERIQQTPRLNDRELLNALGDSNVLICVRAICEATVRNRKADEFREALSKLEDDERIFWNSYTAGTFATAAMDILGLKKYTGDEYETQRLINSGLQLF